VALPSEAKIKMQQAALPNKTESAWAKNTPVPSNAKKANFAPADTLCSQVGWSL
jgi:hypothetical protein